MPFLVVRQSKVNFPTNNPKFCLSCKLFYKMALDIKMHTKQKFLSEFLHVEKKLHPLTYINAYWTIMETKQWTWTEIGGYNFSSGESDVWLNSAGIHFLQTNPERLWILWFEYIANGASWVGKECFEVDVYPMLLLYSCMLQFGNK